MENSWDGFLRMRKKVPSVEIRILYDSLVRVARGAPDRMTNKAKATATATSKQPLKTVTPFCPPRNPCQTWASQTNDLLHKDGSLHFSKVPGPWSRGIVGELYSLLSVLKNPTIHIGKTISVTSTTSPFYGSRWCWIILASWRYYQKPILSMSWNPTL